MTETIDYYSIPIVDYLLTIGEPLVKVGRNYYQHKHHDSLVINIQKNYFVWNSRLSEKNAKGGAVQYLQIVYGLSLGEALAKVESDLKGLPLKTRAVNKQTYPKKFEYRIKEVDVPLEAQKYLVAKRKIPNRIVKYFFSIGLIQQNENSEIIFKWYKGNEVVGFSKQGTEKLSEEIKEKYHTKREYFKYVAPTTEKDTYWGFNFLKGEPQNLFFFESPIDLLSYYTIHEQVLDNNFWLISIDGLAKEKVFAFLKYGVENFNLKETAKSLSVCFDNDIAGKKALKELQHIEFNNIPFQNETPKEGKDWNDVLKINYMNKEKKNESYSCSY